MNVRALRKFPDRGCGEAQPQRLERAPRLESSRPSRLVTRCGWSVGHSRSPLVAAPPRYAVSRICDPHWVGNSEAPRTGQRHAECNSAIQQIANLRYGPEPRRADEASRKQERTRCNGDSCRPLLFNRLLAAFGLAILFLAPLTAFPVVSEDHQPVPEWIWAVAEAKPDQVAFFRKTFEMKPGLLKAILLGAGDDKISVYINGALVVEIDNYQRATGVDITKQVRPGTNLIAVRAWNKTGPAAFGLLIELASDDGRQQWIASDRTWLASLLESKGWNQEAFVADGWTQAFSYGAGHIQPWGNPFDPQKAVDAYNSWKLALGTNGATDASTITALPGFKAELIRSARPDEGSWVSMAFDPKGRVTIAREKRGLLRMSIGTGGIDQVEVINDTLLECRGLLYAHNSLYVNANNSKGFYRLRDTDGDDQFDEIKLLLRTEGGVGHGRNHIVLGPDGMIYLVHGNDVSLTPLVSPDSPHEHYGEDQLIPCPWDDTWFNGEVRAPGGHILRTDPDGKTWTLIAGGFRNPLDAAFNEDGEMFTYDADMERDIGAPWYRPTRVNHVVSGGEYGWRRGTGKWPAYYPDSLPSTHDIGVGSPTGIKFGTRSHFPSHYRKALFICDWAYGRIIAVHLKPKGATYSATSEAFVTGRPLNVTDLQFGPDGAMYFITGGRGTQSGLYRVSYVHPKPESTEGTSASAEAEERQCAQARALRRSLETFHAKSDPRNSSNILMTVWPHLSNSDPWIRYAARIAIEQQPPEFWQNRALAEQQTDASLTALTALSRVGEKNLQSRLLERLHQLPLRQLTEAQQLQSLRIYALAFIRMGQADANLAAAAARKLEAVYPSPYRFVNHELCQLLVYLKSPVLLPRTLALLAKAEASEDLLQYLFFLRYVRDGWTQEQRQVFFSALDRADQLQGARDYIISLKNIRSEVVASLTQAEREALGPLLSARDSFKAGAKAPTPFVKEWQLDDLDLMQVARGRSFESGKTAFAAAQCILCHRIGEGRDAVGGVIGPDLASIASRFTRRDMAESIINPSKIIDDKYRNTLFTITDNSTILGTIELEDARKVVIRTGPLSDQVIEVPKVRIQKREPSNISPMPNGLLNVLSREQILDLLAYLESGGKSDHGAFRK